MICMLYSVMYNKSVLNRYVIRVNVSENYINAIIDTACSTTLMPLSFAEVNGDRLNHTATVIVGGSAYKASLYVMPEMVIGDFKATKVVVFAAEYEGILGKSVLIGQNILNNINITQLTRNESILKFNFSPWSLVKNKKYPFAFFFGGSDNGPKYPADLAVEIHD